MRYLLLALIVCSAPAWSVAMKGASVQSNTKRVVVFDGDAHAKGSTWVNPTTSTFLKTPGTGRNGGTALELKFHDKNVWIGWGFDWNDWKTGRKLGTDTSKMTNLDFWIKSTGLTEDLQIQLLCNGDVIDTPEHHAPKMSLAKYCPDFRDGQWHQVVIPLADMAYPKGYDPKVVTMIDFGFWTNNEATGSIEIDDIAFDNRPVGSKSSK